MKFVRFDKRVLEFAAEELVWLKQLGYEQERAEPWRWFKGSVWIEICADDLDKKIWCSFAVRSGKRLNSIDEHQSCPIGCILSETGYRGPLLLSTWTSVLNSKDLEFALDSISSAFVLLTDVLVDDTALASMIPLHQHPNPFFYRDDTKTIGCGYSD